MASAVVVAACAAPVGVPADQATVPATELLAERIEVVAAHVAAWADAPTLADAKAAAEAAANHVVGPGGPGFGDRDGDGTVRGPSDAGILPGVDGDPAGFALAAAEAGGPGCITRDILGGSWEDPAARWAELDEVVAAWRPDRNTMPRLASHAQRIVGWALLTFATDDLGEAQTFAGHARIHVQVARDAVADCR